MKTNRIIKSVIEIFESVNESEQKRLLCILKLEKARILAKELDKHKSTGHYSDKDITEVVQTIRNSY